MAASFVGLDIGTNQIKVAELRKSGAGYEVVALGVAPTPPEAYDNSEIVDVQLLGQAVKALLKSSGVKSNVVVSSVSGQASVVVRVIDVPQMSPAELAENMKWEVERHVPFQASTTIMDYQQIDRPEGYAEGQNMDVLLAVAQQDMVNRHVDMLRAAGLKPKAIDVEPLAAGRTLLDLAGPDQPGYTVAIVNIGANNTDIGIFRDKLLTMPRTLPLAGENLTRAIADTFQVDMAVAEQYKLDVGQVMFGQAPPQQGYGQDAGFGGVPSGFLDFSVPGQPAAGAEAPNPFFQPGGFVTDAQPSVATSAPTSSPSGRMPFDFSTPGEEQPAAHSASGEFGAPAPIDPSASQYDFAPAPGPEFVTESEPQAESGALAPLGAEDAPVADLPVQADAAAVDPALEQHRMNVFNAMAPVLSELAQELRRSLEYYRGRTGDSEVHEIRLVGGTARLRGIAEFLQAELGIHTIVANPLQHVHVGSKNYSADYLNQISTLFSISIGLGVRELIPVPAKPKVRSAKKTKS